MTPLLICSVGPYALHRRPLAIGIPLDRVVAVRPLERLTPFPVRAPGLLGLALHEGQLLPALSVTHLLGLPQAQEAPAASSHLVVVKGSAGLLVLVVATASGIDRPLHWADPNALAPIICPALAGAVLHPERWIAVLDPIRLSTPQLTAA